MVLWCFFFLTWRKLAVGSCLQVLVSPPSLRDDQRQQPFYDISSCINCMFVLQRLDTAPWGQISQLCQNSGLVPTTRLWRHHYRDRRARMAASISILPSLYNLSKCFSLHWGPKKKKDRKADSLEKRIRCLEGWPNRSDNVADPAQTDNRLRIGISGICTLDDSNYYWFSCTKFNILLGTRYDFNLFMSKLYEVLTTPHWELDTKWVDPSKKCMQFQMICRFWATNQFVLKQGVLFI